MAWGTKKNLEDVKCSLIGGVRVNIYPVPKRKIEILMAEYLHTEWVGYLVGERQDCPDLGLTNFDVKDIIIRLHEESSGGTCLAEPALKQGKDWIGAIHSHHGMGAFHSGQDDHTVDRNWPVSITVARDKKGGVEYSAKSVQKTLCGKPSLVTASVHFVTQVLFDEQAFKDESKKNIDRGRPEPASNCAIPFRHSLMPIAEERFGLIPPRRCNLTGYTDKSGRVISQKEYDAIMEGIYDR